MDENGPEISIRMHEYDFLGIRMDQKESPRPGSIICCRQDCARKSHEDAGGRNIMDKN